MFFFQIYVCSISVISTLGILDHYYDACFGYMDTHERRNAFNFTKPIHPPSDIAIIIDEEKFEGDHHDLTGKTNGKVFIVIKTSILV